MIARAVGACALAALAAVAGAEEARPGLVPCHLPDVEHGAWCGSVRRALDPTRPQGVQIDVHYAVLPALARNRKPDPVFFLAGGPGQSAIDLAGPAGRSLARLSNRRDLVFIDQRGTGRSAPLQCEPDRATMPLAEQVDPARQLARLRQCREQLRRLPWGDLRQFTTTLAMQDADAVRVALGAARVDLVGGSYGTRAALEYLRQFPQAVRRLVIDGAAPPDMVLPAAFSHDNQAALDAVLAACEAAAACRQRYPGLRRDWHALIAGLPRKVSVAQPVTGAVESLFVTRAMVLGLVRAPLYVPALASALPLAISEAAGGRYEALVGLAAALGGGGSSAKLAEGMHFSVVCAEDQPGSPRAADTAAAPPGADFGATDADFYRQACADWPRGEVPAAFYGIAPSPAAALVLSGGADPATPPRHGQRVARALGAKARHVIVAEAGHGVMALPCMRDVVFRFIDAAGDDEALAVDTGCAAEVPRPPAFVPVAAEAAR